MTAIERALRNEVARLRRHANKMRELADGFGPGEEERRDHFLALAEGAEILLEVAEKALNQNRGGQNA